MKLIRQPIFKLVILCLSGVVLGVCSAIPDASSPGNCKLQCSGAKIPANNARIRFFNSAVTVACHNSAASAPVAYPVSIPIQFIVEKENPPTLPSTAITGDGTAPTPLVTDVGQPLVGVAFEPTILSGFMGPDNPDDTSTKYKGILTPQDEWCTDSCGIGYLEVVPLCYSDGNTITLGVHSGGSSSSMTITVTP